MNPESAPQGEQVSKTPWSRTRGGIAFVHSVRAAFLGAVLGPVTATAIYIFLERNAPAALLLVLLTGLVCGALCVWRWTAPSRRMDRYWLPMFFCCLLLVPAFFPFMLLAGLGGAALTALRFIPAIYIMGLMAGFVAAEQRRPDRVRIPVGGWAFFAVLLLLPAGYMGHGIYQDTVYAAKRGHGFERVGGFSSTDLKPYDPRVPGSLTPRLADPSAFVIRGTENLPVLDGAEAAFPVYAAFAAACYPDLPPLDEREIAIYDYRKPTEGALTFTNTVYAFERLVAGKVDIFFGAHPSESQMRLAAGKGKELRLTPIAREAFVFFVNEANPKDGLTSEEIRAIYSGAVRNWKELGGDDAEIIAFQRPENSGSQTIMRRFMGETAMEPPLQDRYVGGMGGIVERTSSYRNAPSAIGYSFRFFLTGMGSQPRIKTLAVDGVPPTPETIRSGQYPHVVNLYAVTVKDNPNPHVAPFLAWMRGAQGRELVEKVGYIRPE